MRCIPRSPIFALLLAAAACSQTPPPVATPSSGSVTPAPAATPVATNTGVSEPEAALLQACEKGDLKAVKDLLDKGVNINARDKDGRQPIIEAAYWQHADVVSLLIERAADVNAKKVDGTTALDFAISLRNKEIEQMLRRAGAKADQNVAGQAQPEPTATPAAKTK